MNKFYIVAIFSRYKVMACSNNIADAAATMIALRRPSMCCIVRDGSTGKRYSFAELTQKVAA